MTALNAMAAPQSAAEDPPPGSHWVGPGGERLRYLKAGSGPPVVLIHGAISAAEDVFGALVDALAPERTVYAFDRPGHGWSDRTRWRSATIQTQAEALLRAIRDLELERPVLVGHSYGGSTALAMALAAPQAVRGLVAVSPAGYPEVRLEQMLFGGRSVLGAGDLQTETVGRVRDPALLQILWEAMFTPQSMPDRFRAAFPFERARSAACVVAYGEDSVAMAPSLAQNLAGAPRCAVPVRVLIGGGDIVTNNMHGRVLAGCVPDGRVEKLDAWATACTGSRRRRCLQRSGRSPRPKPPARGLRGRRPARPAARARGRGTVG